MSHRLRYSLSSLLLVILLLAVTAPAWKEWYEFIVIRCTVDRTSHKDFPKLSPFTAVFFENEKTFVDMNGTRYELVSINFTPVDRLLHVAALAFGRDLARKRFAEDLPALLNAAGMNGNKTSVDLELVDTQGDAFITLRDVQMTKSNRRKVHQSKRRILSTDRTLPAAAEQ